MGWYAGSFRSLLGGDVRAADVAVVDATGAQLSGFDPSRPASATLTNATVTTTSSVIAASNAARRRLIIVNDSNGTLFVAFAGTASPTAYSFKVPGNNTWEGPLNDYTGDVSAVRAAGTSTVRVTEIAS